MSQYNRSIFPGRRAFRSRDRHTALELDNMTFLKRAAAALCAVMVAASTLSAFAEDGGAGLAVDPGTETSVIETGDPGSGETSVIDTGTPETTIVDPDEGDDQKDNSRSSLDVADEQYSEIDLTGWTQWDGKTKMVSGTNYYIEGKVAPRQNFTLPQDSRLVLKAGSQLVVYKTRAFSVRGTITVEPGAELITSGKLTVYSKAGVENYGSLKGTVNSTLRISGDLINRSSGKVILSGTVSVYKNGVLLNYGETAFTTSSQVKVTGDFQTPETGRFICSGYFAVTINGRTTQAGYFSLTGEVVNSGVFIFERTVRYYKSKAAKFSVSKSSRLIDYRHRDPSQPLPDTGEDDGSDHEEDTDVGIKGIDVSYAQGAVDWQKVRESGVEFAMLRASRGPVSDTRPAAEDTTFRYNVTEATKAGLEVGVYHYLYAHTVEDAVEEAKFFIKTISPYKITYPVVLDIEEQSQAKLGKKQVTKIVKAFLDEVSAAGYYAMLYSNKTWLTQYLDMSQLSGYEVWLAQWNTVPTYKGEFGMWQYSCKGIVSGIDGYVDLNLSYKNYAKIIKKGGYNHLS